ncbi:hypothetical protein HOU41_gp130 [Proteus phage Stubb]|uniref:Uncharacterized protein n=1 Tax=Proteus phage Stubb TaxID=2315597 RepID=A0A3B8DJ58_9CAUD|nr:hypothetical protein HOU41_gp130 [Proteus phage Stubb]AYJ73214.1 hypothetical protein CPT_Stubb_092 [Proteus phage Stubb]
MFLVTDHPCVKRRVNKFYTARKTGIQFVYDCDNKSVSLDDLKRKGVQFTLVEKKPEPLDIGLDCSKARELLASITTGNKKPTFWERIKKLFKRA